MSLFVCIFRSKLEVDKVVNYVAVLFYLLASLVAVASFLTALASDPVVLT